MIDAGAELVKKLDETGFVPTTALWLFQPDDNEWRLYLASPEVDTRGPRHVYKRIQNAIAEMGEAAAAVPFSSIGLLTTDSELVRLIRKVVKSSDLNRIRFSKNAIDGQFIDDALIYRAA